MSSIVHSNIETLRRAQALTAELPRLTPAQQHARVTGVMEALLGLMSAVDPAHIAPEHRALIDRALEAVQTAACRHLGDAATRARLVHRASELARTSAPDTHEAPGALGAPGAPGAATVAHSGVTRDRAMAAAAAPDKAAPPAAATTTAAATPLTDQLEHIEAEVSASRMAHDASGAPPPIASSEPSREARRSDVAQASLFGLSDDVLRLPARAWWQQLLLRLGNWLRGIPVGCEHAEAIQDACARFAHANEHAVARSFIEVPAPLMRRHLGDLIRSQNPMLLASVADATVERLVDAAVQGLRAAVTEQGITRVAEASDHQRKAVLAAIERTTTAMPSADRSDGRTQLESRLLDLDRLRDQIRAEPHLLENHKEALLCARANAREVLLTALGRLEAAQRASQQAREHFEHELEALSTDICEHAHDTVLQRRRLLALIADRVGTHPDLLFADQQSLTARVQALGATLNGLVVVIRHDAPFYDRLETGGREALVALHRAGFLDVDRTHATLVDGFIGRLAQATTDFSAAQATTLLAGVASGDLVALQLVVGDSAQWDDTAIEMALRLSGVTADSDDEARIRTDHALFVVRRQLQLALAAGRASTPLPSLRFTGPGAGAVIGLLRARAGERALANVDLWLAKLIVLDTAAAHADPRLQGAAARDAARAALREAHLSESIEEVNRLLAQGYANTAQVHADVRFVATMAGTLGGVGRVAAAFHEAESTRAVARARAVVDTLLRNTLGIINVTQHDIDDETVGAKFALAVQQTGIDARAAELAALQQRIDSLRVQLEHHGAAQQARRQLLATEFADDRQRKGMRSNLMVLRVFELHDQLASLAPTGPSYEPSYAEPSYAEPSYAEPSYAEPSYAEPSYTACKRELGSLIDALQSYDAQSGQRAAWRRAAASVRSAFKGGERIETARQTRLASLISDRARLEPRAQHIVRHLMTARAIRRGERTAAGINQSIADAQQAQDKLIKKARPLVQAAVRACIMQGYLDSGDDQRVFSQMLRSSDPVAQRRRDALLQGIETRLTALGVAREIYTHVLEEHWDALRARGLSETTIQQWSDAAALRQDLQRLETATHKAIKKNKALSRAITEQALREQVARWTRDLEPASMVSVSLGRTLQVRERIPVDETGLVAIEASVALAQENGLAIIRKPDGGFRVALRRGGSAQVGVGVDALLGLLQAGVQAGGGAAIGLSIDYADGARAESFVSDLLVGRAPSDLAQAELVWQDRHARVDAAVSAQLNLAVDASTVGGLVGISSDLGEQIDGLSIGIGNFEAGAHIESEWQTSRNAQGTTHTKTRRAGWQARVADTVIIGAAGGLAARLLQRDGPESVLPHIDMEYSDETRRVLRFGQITPDTTFTKSLVANIDPTYAIAFVLPSSALARSPHDPISHEIFHLADIAEPGDTVSVQYRLMPEAAFRINELRRHNEATQADAMLADLSNYAASLLLSRRHAASSRLGLGTLGLRYCEEASAGEMVIVAHVPLA